jgi:nucleoside-diphosphate-sugar epimerase
MLQPQRASGLSRSTLCTTHGHALQRIDLDETAPLDLELPDTYVLLYTIPPAAQAADTRLENLLAALQPAPQRIVYLSTSGVYGDRQGRLTDELTALRPGNTRSQRRVDSEKMLQHWCSINSCELSLLRVAAIYGPDRLGLDRIRIATPFLAENEAFPGNRIHVDDLVRCSISAMDRTIPSGAFNVCDGDFRSASWFSKAVARLAGLPEPAEITRQQAEQVFSPQKLSFLQESRRLDNTRMREILAVEPRSPEEGIRQSLQQEV